MRTGLLHHTLKFAKKESPRSYSPVLSRYHSGLNACPPAQQKAELMQKPAHIDHPIHDLIAQRWSPRAFSDRPVPREALLSLFEAARWSASCFNEQPWRFIVATRDDPAAFEQLASCLNDSSRRWAPSAPVLMLTVAALHFEADGSPNAHALYDLGQAVQNLTLQATHLGLMVHQMAGILPARAHELYQIPTDRYRVMTAVAVGYYGDPEALVEKDRAKEFAPRTRRPLSEMVFEGAWPAE
jgi:nitroreductase